MGGDKIIKSGKPGNQENQENQKTEDIQEAKEAYIHARNLHVWHSVFNHSKMYDEVVDKEIEQPEKLKVYREKKLGTESEDEIYVYYFIGADKGSYLEYSITKQSWGTMFGLVYKADFDE